MPRWGDDRLKAELQQRNQNSFNPEPGTAASSGGPTALRHPVANPGSP